MENENPDSTKQAPTTEPSLAPKISSKKPINKVVVILIVSLAIFAILLALAIAWGLQQKSESKKINEQLSSKQGEIKHLSEEVEKRKQATGEADINKDAFQSVFLKSGQVYFGKITSLTDTRMVLENIYYLREGGDVSLVKLGNEIHGPEDKMFIERKEINFWENLKADGQVAKAIAEYEKANP